MSCPPSREVRGLCLEDVVGEEVSAVVRPTRKGRYVRKCLGRCRSRVTPSSLLVPEVLSSPVPSSSAVVVAQGQDVAKAVLTRAALASLREDRIGISYRNRRSSPTLFPPDFGRSDRSKCGSTPALFAAHSRGMADVSLAGMECSTEELR